MLKYLRTQMPWSDVRPESMDDSTKKVVDKVARTAFNRVNTSISIAIASQVSGSLGKYVDRFNTILVCVVIYTLLSFDWRIFNGRNTTVSTAKGLIGIVGTTTIMHQISDIGNSLVPIRASDSMGKMSNLPITSPSIPSVVLGTCFVIVSGSIPPTTREAQAIRSGVQYAYSDILMAAVPDKPVRMALSMGMILAIPVLNMWFSVKANGPLSAVLAALSIAGVSFIIDCVLPLSTNTMVEDMTRGVSAVLLIDGLLKPIPSLGADIGPFASWIVAKKFSDTLAAENDSLEILAVVLVLTGIMEALRKVLKGDVVKTLRDLLVLVAAFLLAGWIMGSINTTNPGDTAIVLVSTLFIIRMVFAIMGDKS